MTRPEGIRAVATVGGGSMVVPALAVRLALAVLARGDLWLARAERGRHPPGYLVGPPAGATTPTGATRIGARRIGARRIGARRMKPHLVGPTTRDVSRPPGFAREDHQ